RGDLRAAPVRDGEIGCKRRGSAGLALGRREVAIGLARDHAVVQRQADRQRELGERGDRRADPERLDGRARGHYFTVKKTSDDTTRGLNGKWSDATNSALRTYVPGWTGRSCSRP